MKQQWTKLEAWLKASNPSLLADLNPPASDTVIQRLEQRLGVTLPTMFTECLKVHDGQKGKAGSLFTQGRYLSAEQIESEWCAWRDLLEQGEFEDRDSDPECGIKTGWWRLGWVPFVSNGRGDHLCLDLDPDADGKVGQVIEVSHDVQERCLVSSTFSEWLATEVQLKCHD